MSRLAVKSSVALAILSGCLVPVAPAFADFQVKKGTLTKPAATGSQAIGGVGFQPKALIFFWTRQTAEGLASHVQAGYGFATGPANERAISIASQDAASFQGNTNKRQSQGRCIVIIAADGSGTLVANAELTSLDPLGFTLNWTVTDANADIIHYIALGGSDLTNAFAGSFTKAAGTTDLSITGVGFKPDFLMLLGAHNSGPLDDTPATSAPEAQVAIGFAASSGRATVGAQLEDRAGSTNTCILQNVSNRLLVEFSDACGQDTGFDIKSFDSDGFTITRPVNAAGNDTQLVHYLALKGGNYKVGSWPKSTTGAPATDTVSTVGFAPVGLILASKDQITGDIQAEGRISFGASDGTTSGATWWHDKDALTTSDANERTSTSRIALHADRTTAPYAEATLTSFNSNGFTLTWNPNNPVDDEIIYVAFGDPTAGPPTNYRSIGTAADRGTVGGDGTVSATPGSKVVDGSGTLWKTWNRGQGDRILIDGVNYQVLTVLSETQLYLTTPFIGSPGSDKAYTIARQFTTLQAWEDCISFATPCTYFPVGSASLVADNRSEVGVVYKDSVFNAAVNIFGSTTDATHTITLTAIPGNRHLGKKNTGVMLSNATSNPGLDVQADFVTVEWIEVSGGGGSNAPGVAVNGLNPTNHVVLRNLLLHDNTSAAGIEVKDLDANIDIYNNIVYKSRIGIFLNNAFLAGTQQRVFNNTVYACNRTGPSRPSGIVGDGATSSYPTVTLRNNIAHSNTPSNFDVPSPNAASSNNLASDTTAPGTGSFNSVPLLDLTTPPYGVNFVSTTAGFEDLHLQNVSRAIDNAADLSSLGIFVNDVDDQERGPLWDIGADEMRVDVSLVKTAPASVVVGSILTYTLTVTNSGPSTATNVTVTDPLPFGVEFISASAPCSYNAGTRVVSCPLGNLPVGFTVVTIDVRAVSVSSVTNTATVTHGEADPITSNDTDQATVRVDVPGDAVRFFTATATDSRVVLQWLNPTAAAAPLYSKTEVYVRTDHFTTIPTELGNVLVCMQSNVGMKDSCPHDPAGNGTTYYYTAFVRMTDLSVSGPRFVRGRPFVTSGSVKWAYSTGAAALASPGIGVDAIHAASNDDALHSMWKAGRVNEGQWPTNWTPPAMTGPSQGRPSTIAISIGAVPRVVYLGSQDGQVYAFNADTGNVLWAQPLWLGGTMVQAAPSGMFLAFGGNHDYILVGTRYSSGDNAFYALDRATGTPAAAPWPFSGTGPTDRIGIINNQATVDYSGHRVYFTSFVRGGGFGSNTVWCLNLDTGALAWARAYPNVVTSPTLRGGRLYFGNSNGEVIALNTDGSFAWTTGPLGDGPVKGFVLTDRFSATDDFYFATNTKVYKYQDGGGSAALQWTKPLVNPSMPVFHTGAGRLYVGTGDGQLHVLKTSNGSDDVSPITLGDGLAAVGSPTIDTRELFVYVGSEAGIIYAVQIP